MDKAFQTWTFNGIAFVAVKNGGNVHVMDENGNNYGGWASVENFRQSQRGKISTLAKTMGATKATPVDILGKATLQIRSA